MRFDWGALMRAGIFGLGLKPAEFWALTPAELMLMLGKVGVPTIGRAEFEALMADWPDGDGGADDGE